MSRQLSEQHERNVEDWADHIHSISNDIIDALYDREYMRTDHLKSRAERIITYAELLIQQADAWPQAIKRGNEDGSN